jgi:hypothetical protein
MHTVCVTVLRTSSTDSDGETGTGGNVPLSHDSPQHIRMAQVTTQPQKLHTQLVGLITAVMCQLTGGTRSFVYSMGLQPPGIIYNNLDGDTNLFFHALPPNQSIITGVDLCQEKVGPAQFTKHVPLDTNHLYQFITPHSTLNATQLTNEPTKHVTITSLSLPIYYY